VPLTAISGHLKEVRHQVEHIASRFLEFTTEHVFARFLEHGPPTDADATEAAALVRRLRPLAQQTIDAELARAMRMFATLHLRQHLMADAPPRVEEEHTTVALPAGTMQAVRRLVGAANAAAFVHAATERELHKRTLDTLAANYARAREVDQIN
jgi:hypothetical protein